MPLPQTSLYGSTPQMGGANGGSFAQKRPMMGGVPQQISKGGVNAPKLGAGGARPVPQMGAPLGAAQGLSPSYARTPSTSGLQDVASRMNIGGQQRLIPSETAEGPATQGYGQNAYASAPSVPKVQPTGGVQMGARDVVGSMGSMNPNSGMMPGMARRAFGNMGRPGMAFNPATQLEQTAPPPGFDRPMNPSNPWQNIAQNMGPILQAYQQRGQAVGQDMSWMNEPGALALGPSPMEQQIMASKPEAMANMGAVSAPDIMRNEPMEQPMPMEQPPIGPSPEMMPQMMPRGRFNRRR